MRRLALAPIALALLVSQWFSATPTLAAAASRTELVASAAQTATGNSGTFHYSTSTSLMVGVDITAVAGTTEQLDLWIQASDDYGTTWYDLPADYVLKAAPASATAGTVATAMRDIVDAKTTTTAEQFVAIYKSIPTDTIRVRWVISGTGGPSFTFSVSAVAK